MLILTLGYKEFAVIASEGWVFESCGENEKKLLLLWVHFDRQDSKGMAGTAMNVSSCVRAESGSLLDVVIHS